MKKSLMLIFLMFAIGCTQQSNFDVEQLSLIEKESYELLNKFSEPSFDFEYSVKKNISKLEPKRVYITRHGLYITLNSGFSSESGLFVPRKDIVVNTEDGQDPLYKTLSGNIFRYEIKG